MVGTIESCHSVGCWTDGRDAYYGGGGDVLGCIRRAPRSTSGVPAVPAQRGDAPMATLGGARADLGERACYCVGLSGGRRGVGHGT
jgi:hypothetical protein